MNRKGKLAEIDPFDNDDSGGEQPHDERPDLSMHQADAALFGELTRRDMGRQAIRPLSIFQIYPDVKQPRRAVPPAVRERWSGSPQNMAELFNVWLKLINRERQEAGHTPFNLDDYLWSEAVERRQRTEEEVDQERGDYRPGPMENAFLKVVDLAVSIRQNGLANPLSVQRVSSDRYQIETGERRWLAYHILFGYFNGDLDKPQERDKWEKIPSVVVDKANVWRQAAENTARADLNAIGRARQFALLMMDLLDEHGVDFRSYEQVIADGLSDREYYAQVVSHRVPKGKGELLSNGLGVSHRAAFTRCRTLLGLPDEVWQIGDTLDLPEDELLRLARIEPEERAVHEAHKIAANVASRNNTQTSGKPAAKSRKPPTLFADAACRQGKRLFSKQNQLVAKEIFTLRAGVGEASTSTKQQIRQQIEEMRGWLDHLETVLNGH